MGLMTDSCGELYTLIMDILLKEEVVSIEAVLLLQPLSNNLHSTAYYSLTHFMQETRFHLDEETRERTWYNYKGHVLRH